MNQDKHFLELAIKQAEKSMNLGGFPAGAVLVRDGKIISKGLSLGLIRPDPTFHAETHVIRLACKKLKTTDLNGLTLYASLQPCLMCFSVANWAQISRIVYAAAKTPEMVKKFYYEGSTNIEEINKQNNHKIELVHLPELEQASLALVKKWEETQK